MWVISFMTCLFEILYASNTDTFYPRFKILLKILFMSLVWNSSYLHNLKILPFHGFWKISHVQFMGLKIWFFWSNPFILSWNSNILSSWSILLVRLSTEIFIWLTESWYRFISVWVFFIVFSLLNSIFMSWMVILISFLYLFMFSWNSLRSLFFFSFTSFCSLSVSL